MKKSLLNISLVALLMMTLNSLYAQNTAGLPEGTISFEVNGEKFYATKSSDKLFTGLYKYPGQEARFFEYAEGEPIVLLNPDQSGKYQRHGTPAIPITWWIESDAQGNHKKMEGPGGTRYILVMKFGPGNQYDKEGTFGRVTLDVMKEGNKVYILGEREKEL